MFQPGQWRMWDRRRLCDANTANAFHTLIHRRLLKAKMLRRPYREENSEPGRCKKNRLTKYQELENTLRIKLPFAWLLTSARLQNFPHVFAVKKRYLQNLKQASEWISN